VSTTPLHLALTKYWFVSISHILQLVVEAVKWVVFISERSMMGFLFILCMCVNMCMVCVCVFSLKSRVKGTTVRRRRRFRSKCALLRLEFHTRPGVCLRACEREGDAVFAQPVIL